MLKTLSLIREDLSSKSKWCYGEDDWRGMARALLADGTAAMLVYRAMQAARRHRWSGLEMVFNKTNSALLDCIIGRGAEFGPGFVLVHAHGVVINGAVRGGSGVLIEHQVTIGAEGGQSPTLGDRVFVGAGAKIIGPVRVGDGARIGANAVVVKDVEPHTTVVGVPARCVKRHAGAPSGDGESCGGRAAGDSQGRAQ
jgi:serine O-acetyltransferase